VVIITDIAAPLLPSPTVVNINTDKIFFRSH
jgi:hypothetical protein